MKIGDAGRHAVDAVLEFSVVGSFSRIGPSVRRRLFAWPPIDGADVAGRVTVVSGATSGLGFECASELARLGAHVILLVRDPERGARACEQITASTGNANVSVVIADLGDLESVRRASLELRRLPHIYLLVHNAGALTRTREVTAQGNELTTAVHLLGPYLLTTLILDRLAAGRARVVWVTSGGMYAEPLDVEGLNAPERDYDGVRAYARVKRAQVSLNARWAPQLAASGITMTAVHPGWADTPGLSRSLPAFRRLMAPLLRSRAQGVDTILWLATVPVELTPPGTLWLDRRIRRPHRLARTRRSDTEVQRDRLVEFCRRHVGLDPASEATP